MSDTGNSKATIGVVIPYYQKEAGILRKALQSVQDQKGPLDYHIYIADDESPAPTAAELEAFSSEFLNRITVLNQPNGGPAAARNLALDNLDETIEAIAFLDSDDRWLPLHLENIRKAFRAGADFYFSDYKRNDAAASRFQQGSFVPDGPPLSDSDGSIRWTDPNRLAQRLILDSPIGSPAVAIRRALLANQRFPTDFVRAGEDNILWMRLLALDPRITVSEEVEVECGRGVNVYSHGTWGDERAVLTTLDVMRTHTYMRKTFDIERAVAKQSEKLCTQLDREFWTSILPLVIRFNMAWPALAMDYLRYRPMSIRQAPIALAKLVLEKVYKPTQ